MIFQAYEWKLFMFDYLIVGAGLYGATVARELTDAGNSVLVIDKRPQIANFMELIALDDSYAHYPGYEECTGGRQ